MSLSDLDLILNKEAIIATLPVKNLASNPEDVERVYSTHARTHIPLGDTSRYVDTIFKWVKGVNAGAFIGAVVGNYGEGKTSFQVHIWEQCRQAKVFAVPPFEWLKVADMVDGVAAWTQYVLCKTHSDLAHEAGRLHEAYREKTLREMAENTARRKNRNADEIYATLQDIEDTGGSVDTQVTPDQFLDFCEATTALVKRAGYAGLLVLLDEPEVAARKIGTAPVFQIMFDLANGLLARSGDYGVFLSMPEQFLAQAQSTFSSLPARLQARGCFPRLRDLYGADFAQTLWARYVSEFDLQMESDHVVTPDALLGIGQVGSSERRDLSYGPRTVVSAFRRMVAYYRETGTAYSPFQFVEDCIDSEVDQINPDYASRVLQTLRSLEAHGRDKLALQTLAAFPNGMPVEMAERMGYQAEFADLARKRSVVYKRGSVYGLIALLPQQNGPIEHNELNDAVADIIQEFAPTPAIFDTARLAFTKHIAPRIFEPRQGQQLQGWDNPTSWVALRGTNFMAVAMTGAFAQTASSFPRRAFTAVLGTLRADAGSLVEHYAKSDILIQFCVRWRTDETLPEQRLEINAGDPANAQPGLIRLVLDWAGEPLSNPGLETLVDKEFLTPLGILYLIGKMEGRTLTKDYEAVWTSLRDQLLTALIGRFLGDPTARAQAREQTGQIIPGNAADFLASLSRYLLLKRYPNYVTLIKTPQWEGRINDYTNALKNAEIPLACKRGREAWAVPGETAARAFGTNLMNLTGGFVSGLESLLKVTSTGRNVVQVEFKIHPLEEDIRARIMAEKPPTPLKIKGRECRWLPVSTLLPLLLHSGYMQEELLKIVDMGLSRRTFQANEYKGERILLCLPIDAEEMKGQLREKLAELKDETELFAQIPGFASKFDFERGAQEIEKLKDDAQFDTLVILYKRQHEWNRSFLPNAVERLRSQINDTRSEIIQIAEATTNTRETSALGQVPTGVSRWCTDLSQYIAANLQVTLSELKSERANLNQQLDHVAETINGTASRPTSEQPSILADAWSEANNVKTRGEGFKSKCKIFVEHLHNYDRWRKLLSQSDELHNRLVELKRDPSHQSQAAHLIAHLETVWGDISNNLQTRNLNGLANHRQYEDKFKEIEDRRSVYLRELRSAFEAKKNDVNVLLQTVEAPDGRCGEAFNPDDSEGSYNRLYFQAATHVHHAIRDALRDIADNSRELMYAHEVLGRLPQEQVRGLLDALQVSRQALEIILSDIKPEWLLALIDAPEGQTTLRATLTDSRQAVFNARRSLRAGDESRSDALSQQATDMLALIPESGPTDLKQLILTLIGKGQSPALVLDNSLEGLAELFRYGKVQIVVERSRR